MTDEENILIFKALCSSLREHERIINQKDEVIKEWQIKYNQEITSKNAYSKLYDEASAQNCKLNQRNDELEKQNKELSSLKKVIAGLQEDLKFWKDHYLSRESEGRDRNAGSDNEGAALQTGSARGF